MRSSSARLPLALAALVAATATTEPAKAQQQAEGFAVERLYSSAPGAGWFVMDSLDVHGGLGGAMSLTVGYSKDALRIPQRSPELAVVSDRAFADLGFAATFDRWRLYLNLDAPLVTQGETGTVGGETFTGPSLTLGRNPDTLSDARVGIDARIFGKPEGKFRVGTSAQLFIPNGERADYDTDGTYRAMFRALFAGDVGVFTYAAQLGVHVRPLNDAATPESPRGSELLFGVAGGAKFSVFRGAERLVVGPEVFGSSSFRGFFGESTTALEGLLTGRLESTNERGPQMRVRLGAGAGLHPEFGAPEWRLLLAIEVLGHNPLATDSALPPSQGQ